MWWLPFHEVVESVEKHIVNKFCVSCCMYVHVQYMYVYMHCIEYVVCNVTVPYSSVVHEGS